jgi:hypothetical protein
MVSVPREKAMSLWTNKVQGEYTVTNPIEEIHHVLNISVPETQVQVTVKPIHLTAINEKMIKKFKAILKPRSFMATVYIKILNSVTTISFDNANKITFTSSLPAEPRNLLLIIITLSCTERNTRIKIVAPFRIKLDIPEYTNRRINTQYSDLKLLINRIKTDKLIQIDWCKSKEDQTLITNDDIFDLDRLVEPITPTLTPRVRGSWVNSVSSWCKSIQQEYNNANIQNSSSIKNNLKLEITCENIKILSIANRIAARKDKYNQRSTIGFRCKLIGGLLPTRVIMKERFPEQYHDDICPRCELEPESQEHVLSCIKNTGVITEIGNQIRSYGIKQINKQAGRNRKDESKDKLREIIERANLTSPDTIKKIILAEFPTEWSEINATIKAKITNVTTNLVQEKIWIPRCNTASTSITSGVKWKKQKKEKKKKNIRNINISNQTNRTTKISTDRVINIQNIISNKLNTKNNNRTIINVQG